MKYNIFHRYHNNINDNFNMKGLNMGNEIRKKRKSLGFRMVDLSLRSGVGVSTIWLIEQGYNKRVLPETKKRIAGALDSTVEELFGVHE